MPSFIQPRMAGSSDAASRASSVSAAMAKPMISHRGAEFESMFARIEAGLAVLGFDVSFVLDATYTHDRTTRDGELISADTLAQVTAVNFEPEFGRVVSTRDAIEELELRRVA